MICSLFREQLLTISYAAFASVISRAVTVWFSGRFDSMFIMCRRWAVTLNRSLIESIVDEGFVVV